MTKRLPTIALYAAMMFIACLLTNHTASAQMRDGSGACGAQYGVCNNDLDPALYGASTSVCRDTFGCQNCNASPDLSSAVCARLQGSSGFCSCRAVGMQYSNRLGQIVAVCNVSGSCAVR
jgi:hypothetical protein